MPLFLELVGRPAAKSVRAKSMRPQTQFCGEKSDQADKVGARGRAAGRPRQLRPRENAALGNVTFGAVLNNRLLGAI